MFNLTALVNKIILTGFIGLYCLGSCAITANAKTCFFDGVFFVEEVNYMDEMTKCALLGDEHSLALGSIYEKQRNAKLCKDGIYEETHFFQPDKSAFIIYVDCLSHQMAKEYEYAAFVYRYLKKHSFSDETIAGVLGNMMTECGGNTLELNPFIYEYEQGKHYGLCQWSLKYYPEIDGATGLDQMRLLVKTISGTMSQFGGSFKDFSDLSAREAGEYFADYYERGGGQEKRGENAVKAYEWIQKYVSNYEN